MSNRTAYIQGLRAVADLLEAHPDLPMPYHGSRSGEELIFVDTEDAVAHALLYIAAMEEPPLLHMETGVYALRIQGRIHGYGVELYLRADRVCEKRTIAVYTAQGEQREITEWVIPPALLAAAQQDGGVS
ncbi:hypothetical protein [Thermoactinospora rubra]|uniref:hypothetical protein n=1 Tax=Thermoactinospora rubra TaxID=1088767 RepID=UPI000A10518B|nr:hypothetical protein [Thermoactinospora rubra]